MDLLMMYLAVVMLLLVAVGFVVGVRPSLIVDGKEWEAIALPLLWPAIFLFIGGFLFGAVLTRIVETVVDAFARKTA